MQIKIIAFGIARDIIGKSEYTFDLPEPVIVTDVLLEIERRYPKLQGLASLRVAVNEEYAETDTTIKEGDEVVLIPPVSGG